jgi:hypothetical protein
MIIYQASPPISLVEAYYNTFEKKLDVLLSLGLISDLEDFAITKRHMIGSLICDSGAYSVAKSKGKSKGKSDITIRKVIAFYKAWGFKFDMYFNFDDDFGEDSFEHNLENYLKMVKAGLKPVPVIHNFYNEEIELYLDNYDCPCLALGSDQSRSFDDIEYAVNKIKRLSPDTKIHLLGRCVYEWLCKLPIDACDITSAMIMAGMGQINYWNEEKAGFNKTEKIYVGGRMKELKENEYHYVTHPLRVRLDEYLKETFGFVYADLVGYNAAQNLQLINVRYYTDLQKRINEYRASEAVKA